jgi:ribosomal-protein-serine acetyltransferase
VNLKAGILQDSDACRVAPVAFADAPALAQLVRANEAHLRAFLPMVAGLNSLPAAQAHLRHVLDATARGELYEWHIFERDVLCGAVRLNHIEADNRKASIAYYLGAGHQGRGLATAAVGAVLAHGFEVLGLNRLELKCAAGNLASQRLAGRLGFCREGLLRQAECLHGDYVDHHVYGLLRGEFVAGGK